MIQLGKRSTLCTLLAVAALSISGSALAQNPPAPAPTPAPTDPPAADPNNPPAAAPAPAPAPTPPPAPEPPKVTYPTMQGPMLRLSELFAVRPGMFLQYWMAAAQDPVPKANGEDGGFAKNMYLRRARFYLFGSIGKDITWFLLWESANLGQATLNADGSVNKNFTLYNFNDAWLDLKLSPEVSVQAGLMLIPFTRNILQSTATYWPIDIGGVSASYIAATQTNILRDTGVQIKVNAAEGHFEARGMISQGVKIADPDGGARLPGKNDPRFSAYAQYNFLDTETGYVFNGQYFGRKKVAGIGVGGDFQSIDGDNPYFATSATLYGTIPLKGPDPKNGGDEVGGQIEYLHFHGGGAASPAALGKRDAMLVEAGYYNKAAKISVFGKYEGTFINGANDIFNTNLFGAGLKYFLAEAAANITLQLNYTQFPNQDDMTPAAAKRNNATAVQVQFQLGYF